MNFIKEATTAFVLCSTCGFTLKIILTTCILTNLSNKRIGWHLIKYKSLKNVCGQNSHVFIYDGNCYRTLILKIQSYVFKIKFKIYHIFPLLTLMTSSTMHSHYLLCFDGNFASKFAMILVKDGRLR